MKYSVLISLIVMLHLTGCGRDSHDHPSDITDKALFEEHCADCHALGGTGSFMLGMPSNADTKLLNVQIRNKIREGTGGDSKMPVFHDMSVKEASRIIAYLRSLPHH